MFVRPAPGLSLRDPITLQILSAKGADVPETAFWLRRLRSGDVVLSPLAQPAPEVVPHEESDS